MKTRQQQIIINQWAALLRSLKADIGDEYRCTDDPEDKTPGMLVTFGLRADGDWSYQTGDNSCMGGAYGYAAWGLAYLNRRSNCKELAQGAFAEAYDQMPEDESCNVKIKFTLLPDRFTHGYVATVGDRYVEVLRSYPGDWFVYARIARRICKAGSDEKRPMSFQAAMRDARLFLNREITFELYA